LKEEGGRQGAAEQKGCAQGEGVKIEGRDWVKEGLD